MELILKSFFLDWVMIIYCDEFFPANKSRIKQLKTLIKSTLDEDKYFEVLYTYLSKQIIKYEELSNSSPTQGHKRTLDAYYKNLKWLGG